jgi:hypothetical protein
VSTRFTIHTITVECTDAYAAARFWRDFLGYEQEMPATDLVDESATPRARYEQDRELAERLVAEASEKGLDLVGPDGVLTSLTKPVLEAGLEAELTEHLGYDKHAPEGHNGENSYNGTRPRTVLTGICPVKLDVPRDRDSSFEPQLSSRPDGCER